MERLTSRKTHINLAAIGDFDSGKSTTLGHLLYLCRRIDKRFIEEHEKEANEMGKGSFIYAWMLDKTKIEHERGITSHCKVNQSLQTRNYDCTIIDTPGHRDFINGTIRGISMADVAILIVASGKGEFEPGIGKNGQIREHALLAFAFGVKQMICCVNKMDDRSTNWSQERYTEIVKEVSAYLMKVGFNPDKISFIPISGWLGDNMIEKSPNMPWYTGPCLLEAIDLIVTPKSYPDKPLRISVWAIKKLSGLGTVFGGRVETGTLKPGMSVVVGQCKPWVTEVRSLEMHNQYLTVAVPGNCIGFRIKSISIRDISKGSVISDPSNNPARICHSFLALLRVLNHDNIIKEGYTPLLFCHTAHVPCRFDKLLSTIDLKTGAMIEEQPKFIRTGDYALVRMVPKRQLVVETFAEYPKFGRFAVRDCKRTVAVGIIKSVEKLKADEVFYNNYHDYDYRINNSLSYFIENRESCSVQLAHAIKFVNLNCEIHLCKELFSHFSVGGLSSDKLCYLLLPFHLLNHSHSHSNAHIPQYKPAQGRALCKRLHINGLFRLQNTEKRISGLN